MTNLPSSNNSNRPLAPDILNAIRYYLGGRRTLFIIAAILILGGMALNWGWLAAIGVAPILLALLPCAVMCALGLCMQKMKHGAQDTNKGVVDDQTELAQASKSQARIAEASGLVDPVSRRPLPCATAVVTAHQGQVYYFESRANRDAFEAEPERYLANLQATVAATGSIVAVNGVSNASA